MPAWAGLTKRVYFLHAVRNFFIATTVIVWVQFEEKVDYTSGTELMSFVCFLGAKDFSELSAGVRQQLGREAEIGQILTDIQAAQ